MQSVYVFGLSFFWRHLLPAGPRRLRGSSIHGGSFQRRLSNGWHALEAIKVVLRKGCEEMPKMLWKISFSTCLTFLFKERRNVDGFFWSKEKWPLIGQLTCAPAEGAWIGLAKVHDSTLPLQHKPSPSYSFIFPSPKFIKVSSFPWEAWGWCCNHELRPSSAMLATKRWRCRATPENEECKNNK